MRSVKIIALLLLIALTAFNMPAKCQSFDSAKFVATLQPQYIAIHGLRCDGEFRLKKNNPYNWIGVGFQSHLGKINFDRSASTKIISYVKLNEGDDLWGYGFDLYYKTFLASKAQKKRLKKQSKAKKQPLIYTSPFYIATGASYRFYEINYQDAGWVEYNDGGIQYYSYENPTGKMTIHSPGADLHFGKRIFFRKDVTVFDVYAGVGYRQSYTTSTTSGYRNFSRSFWDYAYSGFYPVAGIKMGFVFK